MRQLQSKSIHSKTLMTSCQCSASAARLGGVGVLLLSQLQTNHIFGHSRVNSNARVKHRLGHTTFESNSNTLGNFTSVGSADVETDNEVGLLIDKDLNVAGTLTGVRLLVVAPFEGLELGVERGDGIGAEFLLSLNL